MNRKNALFLVLLGVCLFPFINAPIALVIGAVFAIVFGNPYLEKSKEYSKKLLQYAIIGLGFGLNAGNALKVSKDGLWLTIATIATVFFLGFLFNKIFKVEKNTAILISSGTAICGGSAIAAVAPIVKAKPEQMSIAIGAVFILNALALFVFPAIGHLIHLSQSQFGLWSAIAIHDTSSVVGTAQTYGEEALKIATTVKLSRALWIIPLSIAIALLVGGKSKIKIPYFIIGFVLTMLIATFLPQGKPVYDILNAVSKQMLVVTLFLIGATMSIADLKKAGWKSLAYASSTWIVISIVSLFIIKNFY